MHDKQEDSEHPSPLPFENAEEGVRKTILAVEHAIRAGSFERYQKRKAENTVRTQKAHLALFEVYLSEVGVPLQGLFTRPASWGTVTFGLVEDFVEWQLKKATRSNRSMSAFQRSKGMRPSPVRLED